MPQSTAALRQKAEVLRALRSPQGTVSTRTGTPAIRRVWAKVAHRCVHGDCLALEARQALLWVLVRDASGQEAWVPALRILSAQDRRDWSRNGFG